MALFADPLEDPLPPSAPSLDGIYTPWGFIYPIHTGAYGSDSYTQIYTIISIISVYAPRSFIYTITRNTVYTGQFHIHIIRTCHLGPHPYIHHARQAVEMRCPK